MRSTVGALAVLVVLGGCGAGDGAGSASGVAESVEVPDAGCSEVVDEAIDPRSAAHVLPGAEPDYERLPPTSGPHQPVPSSLGGVLDEPLPPAQQVGVLERGSVLVHVGPTVEEADARPLVALAGEETIVMANPDLDAAIEVTAWGARMRCGSVDVGAIEEFAAQRAGGGPGGHG